ncbi:glycoside hydrolase family 30 protein [Flavobacterium capsici]|uniref:Glycoside hydrolase family 30 beta sandwich domain-containing protein n=1 Tax=Flavobacterium capsici TaxID=3075618 RepID=A0AA96F1F8_9FLAO|nr:MULTISPECIES: glycoside hydrolase family 30 beta sandwich domain-containing protein [unclassified Flavobacterium]WNM18079.1 glycoside hydrolase family 30 beta sandwich domain-containing protein [Flavobacterium sp. PMR2A8]WNM22131.1 glycoside hydrolase family 30 beta sandwich domain-containing protein [Flavobacterium sp. PMTSA4]
MKKKINRKWKHLASLLIIFIGCSSSPDSGEGGNTNPITNDVTFWLTKGNETVKLEKQNTVLGFTTNTNSYPNIEVNQNQTFQTIDGFGYTLTGGSAEVINQLAASKKQELLQDLFGNSINSISVSYLRIGIGATDLNSSVFSYDDMPAGQTDVGLTNFSLSQDSQLINLLKEIILINPNIKIMATPWSAPVWMKDNGSSVGGSLQQQYYGVYAQYFVRYIQAMQQEGISISAITPQNEPLHGGNNPSMLMTALQQADFIKNHLGPAFQTNGITTKIIVYDHNCDRPDYPITVMSDSNANQYIDGAAFHLYGGDISALSNVHNAFPNKNLYFTEQYTAANGSFEGDLKWHLKNVIIGSMRNWSKNALEWNLANNTSFGPHTQGGCDSCKGAITINGNFSYTKNVSYYIIAHASKFVPQGSIRIGSSQISNVSNVVFKTPDGKYVMIAVNDSTSAQVFNVKFNGKWVLVSLDSGSAGTFIW